MKHPRKIIRICIAHRWITDDLFAFYKINEKAKQKEFLTDAQLKGWKLGFYLSEWGPFMVCNNR